MRTLLLGALAVSTVVLSFACGDDTGGGTTDGDMTGGDPTGGGTTSSTGTGEPGGSICDDVGCDDVPRYADLAWTLCTDCHSSDAEVRAAEGVPADSDYTTYAGASRRARAVVGTLHATGDEHMPPPASPQPTEAQIDDFTAWGCCGAPE